MPVSLSIKNVPDEIVDKLRQRAAQNHRSLQGELLFLLEEAVNIKKISVKELREKSHSLDSKHRMKQLA